jgi:hypothetical protein
LRSSNPTFGSTTKLQHIHKKILDLVSAKISDLENAFEQYDSHNVRKATLNSAIVKLDADENQALSATSDDAAAINAIVTARTMKDIHAARMSHVDGRIASTKQNAIAAGAVARQYALEVAQQLANLRFDVALDVVEATYEHQPVGDPKHLARHAKSVIAAEHLVSGVTAHLDESREIESLRHLRSNFAQVSEACEKEDGLALTFPSSWTN